MLLQLLSGNSCANEAPAVVNILPSETIQDCDKNLKNPLDRLLYIVYTTQEDQPHASNYSALSQNVRNGIECSDDYHSYLVANDVDRNDFSHRNHPAVKHFRSLYFKLYELKQPFYTSLQAETGALYEISGMPSSIDDFQFIELTDFVSSGIDVNSDFFHFKDKVWFYPIALNYIVNIHHKSFPITAITYDPYYNNTFSLMEDCGMHVFYGIGDKNKIVQVFPQYDTNSNVARKLQSLLKVSKRVLLGGTNTKVVTVNFAADFDENEKEEVIEKLCEERRCVTVPNPNRYGRIKHDGA